MPSQQPSWLTRHSSSTSSIGIASTVPKRRMPALLASMLTGPKRSLVVGHQRGPGGLVADVVVGEVRAPPELVGQRLALVLGHVGDDDPGALGDVRADDARALPHRATGDDGDLARPDAAHQTSSSHDRVGREADGRVALGEEPPSCLSRSGRSQTEPEASKRCSTTGAATSATIPP